MITLDSSLNHSQLFRTILNRAAGASEPFITILNRAAGA